jgi:sterol desaturase/sphingolipid hydroxylase (fatty acid hydroxylase superfamily)
MIGILDHWRTQLLGTFLAPGSTLSLVSLAVTLGVALMLLVHARQSDRALKPGVAVRAIFPRRLWKSASGKADLGWMVYSIFGSGLMFGWAFLSAGAIREAVHGATGNFSLFVVPAGMAITLATIAAFIAYELAYWFDHWLKHRVAWLWAFHRVHHSAEHLSLLTNFRVHPVDTIIFYNIVAVVVGTVEGLLPLILGAEAAPQRLGATNVIVFGTAIVLTHLQHSHFWVRLGPVWGKILLGPAHHQIHHSNHPDHFNRNFGSSLALFDRMFGSFHLPEPKRGTIIFGVDSPHRAPHGISAMTIQPFAEAATALRARAKTQSPMPSAPRRL